MAATLHQLRPTHAPRKDRTSIGADVPEATLELFELQSGLFALTLVVREGNVPVVQLARLAEFEMVASAVRHLLSDPDLPDSLPVDLVITDIARRADARLALGDDLGAERYDDLVLGIQAVLDELEEDGKDAA